MKGKMSRLLLLAGTGLCIVGIAVGCDGFAVSEPETETEVTNGYTLVWSDEFDGDSINSSIWSHNTGGEWWGSREQTYFTDVTIGDSRNSYVANGFLHIVARAEAYKLNQFTSARLTTKDKKSITYGRIEARIKAPHKTISKEMSEGVWPAFFMLGDSIPMDSGWPHGGEITVWESGGLDPDLVRGALWWLNDNQPVHVTVETNHHTPLHHDFNVYAVEWDYNTIAWFINDDRVGIRNIGGMGDVFRQPFHVVLSLEVEGLSPSFVGQANPTDYPQVMLVDWVRVWEKL